jgi:DNA-directed RNA polymerase specialized sigma24 family protein
VTFDEWTRSGLPQLLRFATALCGSGHLAEDVVQDVALKAHRNWARIGAAGNPDAYLRRMVVNEYLSWRRKWSRYVPRAHRHGRGRRPARRTAAERPGEHDRPRETQRRVDAVDRPAGAEGDEPEPTRLRRTGRITS